MDHHTPVKHEISMEFSPTSASDAANDQKRRRFDRIIHIIVRMTRLSVDGRQ